MRRLENSVKNFPFQTIEAKILLNYSLWPQNPILLKEIPQKGNFILMDYVGQRT